MDAKPVQVPMDKLPKEALENLIRELLLREAGNDDPGLEVDQTSINQVTRAIRMGEYHIVFDPNTETVCLMKAADWLAIDQP